MVYAHSDNDFNSDVWIAPLDGSRPPFNLSRHPDNEYQPGLVARRQGDRLHRPARRRTRSTSTSSGSARRTRRSASRDRTLEKALEKVEEGPQRDGPAATARRPATALVRRRRGGAARAAPATARRTNAGSAAAAGNASRREDRLGRHPRPDPPRLDPQLDRKRPALVARLQEAGVHRHRRRPAAAPTPSRSARASTPKLLATQTGSQRALAQPGRPDRVALRRRAGQPDRRRRRRSDYRFTAYQEVERGRTAPRRLRPGLADDARLVLRRAARQPQLGRHPPQVRRHGGRVRRRSRAGHRRAT